MKTIFHRCISVLLALLLALGVLGPGQVQAAPNPLAICVWTGASLNHGWSVDANWVNCSGLSNGMTAVLVFPAGVPNKDSQNDLANLNIVSIGLEVSGYTLSGNQIVLTPGVSPTPPYEGIGTDAASGSSTLSMNIQLANNIKVKVPNASAALHLTGAISGANGITKTGSGTLNLDAANSFSGGVTVSAGKVIISQSQAGGSGTITVQDGATLTVASAIAVLTNPLSLRGTGSEGLGALHFEGSILYLYGKVTLAAAATIQSTTGTLDLDCVIEGTGNLTLDGPSFRLSGSGYHSNTFNGAVILPRGVLLLNHPAGYTAVPGNLSLGTSDAGLNAQVLMMADNQFSATSQVTLGKNTVFNLQGYSQTLRSIDARDRPCEIYLGANQNVTLTFDTISGSEKVVHCDVSGTGKLLVKGNNGVQSFGYNDDPAKPFNGSLDVQANGNSYLYGFHMTGAYYLHPNTGGGMLFTGSTVGSFLADDAWTTVAMPAPAERTQAGSLLLNGTGTSITFTFYAIDAIGPRVSGPVSLGSATLYVCYFTGFEPSLANTPANPNWRMLIQNDAGTPVTGTFNGLPEGSQVSLPRCMSSEGVYPARLTYQGGDGNDVVVTRLVEDALALQVFPIPTLSSQAVSLQAVLSAADNPAGATPVKKAVFYDGGQPIGEASFSGLTAVLPGVRFAGGSHSLQARLVDDPDFADAISGTTNFSVKGLVFLPALRK